MYCFVCFGLLLQQLLHHRILIGLHCPRGLWALALLVMVVVLLLALYLLLQLCHLSCELLVLGLLHNPRHQ
jgi:hypothetical protein